MRRPIRPAGYAEAALELESSDFRGGYIRAILDFYREAEELFGKGSREALELFALAEEIMPTEQIIRWRDEGKLGPDKPKGE